ncbi:MAG: hypothetical protein ACLP1E_11515 [Acidimicrobiales bacterium]
MFEQLPVALELRVIGEVFVGVHRRVQNDLIGHRGRKLVPLAPFKDAPEYRQGRRDT